MKKSVLIAFVFLALFLQVVSACDLEVSMINQDPYPAIPGDYVEVVFQVEGVAAEDCETTTFELLEKYPIVFDPNQQATYMVTAGAYRKDYSSFLVAPYRVRIDEDALDGDNPIEVQYQYGSNAGFETKTFNLNIEDVKADFEIFVKDYDLTMQTITFEILNIGKSDIEALTLEIPKQDNIQILGSKTNIIGDLDSNEYTSADFSATATQGKIIIKISYTDSINTRRTITKEVEFEPEYFKSINKESKSWTSYIIYIIIIAGVVYYFYRRHKKKKLKENKHKH